MGIAEKAAYLRGLFEGLDPDTSTKEGKLLTAMLDVLEEAARELQILREEQEALADGLDAVNSDLEDLESVIYGEEDEEEEASCYAAACPECGETVYFDESVLEDGGVDCPRCGKRLEFLPDEPEAGEDGEE